MEWNSRLALNNFVSSYQGIFIILSHFRWELFHLSFPKAPFHLKVVILTTWASLVFLFISENNCRIIKFCWFASNFPEVKIWLSLHITWYKCSAEVGQKSSWCFSLCYPLNVRGIVMAVGRELWWAIVFSLLCPGNGLEQVLKKFNLSKIHEFISTLYLLEDVIPLRQQAVPAALVLLYAHVCFRAK